MRKMLILAVLLALAATPALAQKPIFWMQPTFGLNTYAMDDVNYELRTIDAEMPGDMDEIERGSSYGITFGVDLPTRITLAVGYERLSASSDYSDPTGSLDYDFAANILKGSLIYRLNTLALREFSAGISFGNISSAGDISLTSFGEGSFSFDVDGSAPMIEGFLTGDFRLSPRFALSAQAGYRVAEIEEIEVAGITIKNPDGSDYTVDYGGLLLRVGLKIRL